MADQGIVFVGGQPKQAYWTPDGRKIMALPDIHSYEKRDARGRTIEAGTRDINFDRGWLPQKPPILKPYCPHCDKWHDTLEEVNACGVKKGAIVADALKNVPQPEPDRIEKLETDMTELKTMFKMMLEKMSGGATKP